MSRRGRDCGMGRTYTRLSTGVAREPGQCRGADRHPHRAAAAEAVGHRVFCPRGRAGTSWYRPGCSSRSVCRVAEVPARDRPAGGGTSDARARRSGVIHARILAALRLLGCDDDAQMAFHAEAAGTLRRSCATRPPPRHRAAEAGVAPRSCRAVRAGTAVCRRRQIPRCLPGCMRASPSRCRWSTAGRMPPTPVSARSRCGGGR